MTFYSQCGQDALVEEIFFKGFKNGVFVDIGAYDGKWINNTLYFEENHQWFGINIEPIKSLYDRLIINRPNCININCAIDETEGMCDFCCNNGHSEAISGLVSHYDQRHKNRVEYENSIHGSTSQIIQVETKRLDNILEKYNMKHIHYLSIDVEGAEFAVIKSINFDKVFIDVIDFENNYDDCSNIILRYLQERGYILYKWYTDVIMIHKDSVFYKNIEPK